MTANDRDQHIPIEDLSTYADGEIREAADRERIEQHLAVCEFCRQELSELQAISALLADLPEPELPRSFRLTEADLDVGPEPTPIAPWFVRYQTLFRYASVAAVFLLAVVITVDLLPDSGEDTEETAIMMDQPAQESLDTDEAADGPGIMSVEEDDEAARDDSETAGDVEVSDEGAIHDAERDADLPATEEDTAEDAPIAESAPAEAGDDQADHPLAIEDDSEQTIEPFSQTMPESDALEQQQPIADDSADGVTGLQMAAIVLTILSVFLILAGFVLPRWWQSSAR